MVLHLLIPARKGARSKYDINYRNKRCEQNYLHKPQRARMNEKFKYKLKNTGPENRENERTLGEKKRSWYYILNDTSGLYFQ